MWPTPGSPRYVGTCAAVMRMRTSAVSPVSSPSATFRQIFFRHRPELTDAPLAGVVPDDAPEGVGVNRTGVAARPAARFSAPARCVSAMSTFSSSMYPDRTMISSRSRSACGMRAVSLAVVMNSTSDRSKGSSTKASRKRSFWAGSRTRAGRRRARGRACRSRRGRRRGPGRRRAAARAGWSRAGRPARCGCGRAGRSRRGARRRRA